MHLYLLAIWWQLYPSCCCDHVTEKESHDGGSVSISCPYEAENQNNLKYVCRGTQPSTCLQQALITSDNKHNGQFTLTDDKETRKFTVDISSLTQNDSGPFLCGVRRNSGFDVFSAVKLEVEVSWWFRRLKSDKIKVQTQLFPLCKACASERPEGQN
uniref:Immunoglobulin V-set domain-containing protein n=1 Tax=Amphiprion percula TaxID=161767 RepID=A0A3P8SZ24_AMPPE